MLDVIKTRGLPLDRITTTDVWATDTISANLPPMDSFKERMDQWIWDNYHIEVEHLCARNPDGSKRTYEQMFYHIPQRKKLERERERERETVPSGNATRISGTWSPLVSSNPQKSTGYKDRSRVSQGHAVPIGAKSSRPNGFPAQISPWCRKLKIDYVKPLFQWPGTAGKKKYCAVFRHCGR